MMVVCVTDVARGGSCETASTTKGHSVYVPALYESKVDHSHCEVIASSVAQPSAHLLPLIPHSNYHAELVPAKTVFVCVMAVAADKQHPQLDPAHDNYS